MSAPMPDPPVRITVEEAVPCDHCDEDGPPYYGLVVCGFCDGDKWYWRTCSGSVPEEPK